MVVLVMVMMPVVVFVIVVVRVMSVTVGVIMIMTVAVVHMVVQPRVVRVARVLAEHQRLDRDRHGVGRQADAAEIDPTAAPTRPFRVVLRVGLVAGLVVVGYGVVALGAVVAERLPIQHPGLATAAGVAVVMALLQVLGAIPVLGSMAVGGLLLAGLGAVLLTYFGLKEFTPATLPD